MGTTDFAPELEQFIRANVHSIEQLEILLLLFSGPGREWTVEEVSGQLYWQPESVISQLDDLGARGLLQVRDGKPRHYRYDAGNAEHEIIRQLERAFRERKDAVITLVFSRPVDPLRAFSNAFRFRRND